MKTMYFLIIATVMATFSMNVEAQKTSNGKKVLVAYFSRSGNTKAIASHIKELTGGDLFEIQTAKPYPADYHACTEVAKSEKHRRIRYYLHRFPELVGDNAHADPYIFGKLQIGRKNRDPILHARWRRRAKLL